MWLFVIKHLVIYGSVKAAPRSVMFLFQVSEATVMGLASVQFGGLQITTPRSQQVRVPAMSHEETLAPHLVKLLSKARHAVHAAGAGCGMLACWLPNVLAGEHVPSVSAMEPLTDDAFTMNAPLATATWISAILLAQSVRNANDDVEY